MKLSSKNILLRALEPEDLALIFQVEINTAFWEVSSTQTPFSKYVLKQYLANAHQDIYEAKQLRLVIENNNKVVGLIDLFNFDFQHKRAGIGVLILKEFQQKCYADEALEVLIKYASKTLNLHQLYANITSDNANSISLFKKHLFKEVGAKKDWIFSEGKYKDELLFQLILG